MKNFLCLLLLAFTLSACGQSSEPFTFTFDHIALSVSDVNRSAQFYSAILGLKELKNPTGNPLIRWFDAGGKQLHLITGDNAELTLNKNIHFSLSVSDLDACIRWLSSKGVPYSNWPGDAGQVSVRAGDNVRQVYIQDPDGYWIEINNHLAAP